MNYWYFYFCFVRFKWFFFFFVYNVLKQNIFGFRKNEITSLYENSLKHITVERENDEDEDESMDYINKEKYVTKLLCQSKQVYVGVVVKLFETSFQENLLHVNTKRIQAKSFEADKSNKNVRVLQMDFTITDECMHQSEVQSALWSQ